MAACQTPGYSLGHNLKMLRLKRQHTIPLFLRPPIRHSRTEPAPDLNRGGNPASGYLRARRQESAHMANIRHSCETICVKTVSAFFLSFRRKPESLFLLRPLHRKGARSARLLYGIPAFAGMTRRGAGVAEWAVFAECPRSFYTAWKAGIQRKYSAVRAHCSAWRRAPALKGARSARIIHWIPACAGMARRRCVLRCILIRVSFN